MGRMGHHFGGKDIIIILGRAYLLGHDLSSAVRALMRVRDPRPVARVAQLLQRFRFGIRVLGFGFWASGFEFWVSGFGIRVSGFGSRL